MSGGDTLKVDPTVLVNAAINFGQDGTGLADLAADVPLGEAAFAVPELATARACKQAQAAVVASTTAVANAINTYGGTLFKAAMEYVRHDETAAGRIKEMEIPGGR